MLTKDIFDYVTPGHAEVPGQAYYHHCPPPPPPPISGGTVPVSSGGGSYCTIVPVYGPCPVTTGPVESPIGPCLIGFQSLCPP